MTTIGKWLQASAIASTASIGAIAFSSIAWADIVHNDDVIINGGTSSLCVGFDCINGENFGSDTIRLKENNLRIHFEDTSTGSFPTNDWRIIANDQQSGGSSYLAIQDSTANRIPFRVEAGAREHALVVESDGDVGIGTLNPVLELHVVRGDSPGLRLEQDGSSGFTPQTWDIAGNEANFFVRDVTNGSALPFRIQPGAASSLLYLANDEQVGIGTSGPDAPLEVRATSANVGAGNAVTKLVNASGPTAFQLDPSDNGTFWNFAAPNDDTFNISRSGTGSTEFSLTSAGNLTITGSITTGGPTCGGGCDAVFDENYDLPSISDHAQAMWRSRHLPKVGPTVPYAPINLSEKVGQMLNELETAHIYIEQLHERIGYLEASLGKKAN